MKDSRSRRLKVLHRSVGWVSAQFRNRLLIDIQLIGGSEKQRVAITLSGRVGVAPSAPWVERAEFPITCRAGLTCVGRAFVDWNEVPFMGLEGMESYNQRSAHEAIWASYQAFLAVTADQLHLAARQSEGALH